MRKFGPMSGNGVVVVFGASDTAARRTLPLADRLGDSTILDDDELPALSATGAQASEASGNPIVVVARAPASGQTVSTTSGARRAG